MTKAQKNWLVGSMAVAGLVAVLSIVDMILNIPFSGGLVMDIMFLVSAALVLFMGYDAYKELN